MMDFVTASVKDYGELIKTKNCLQVVDFAIMQFLYSALDHHQNR
jgi:hypothetical protein